MEFLRGDQPELEPTSDQSGEFDGTKKRRKKVTKIAKRSSVFRSATQEVDRSPNSDEEAKHVVKEQVPLQEIETKGPELQLPEMPQGELVINHADEGSLEGPAQAELVQEDALDSPTVEDREDASHSAEMVAEEELVVSEDAREGPPRVAPPFLFEFPAESLNVSASTHASAETPPSSGMTTIQESSDGEVPAITPHRLHPNYRESMFDPSRALPTEPVVTEREARRREYNAGRKGVSRGVLAGGIAGWWLGRRRGKSLASAETHRELKARDEAVKKLAAEKGIEQEQAQKRLSVLERTRQELEKVKQQVADLSSPKQPHQQEGVSPELRQPVPTLKREASVAPLPYAEQLATQSPVEAVPLVGAYGVPQPQKREKASLTTEKNLPIEERPTTEELYAVPEGRRLEMSSWHRIEVDEATGRVVEKPSAEYGEAFVREQQQEKLARNAATAQTAAQVGMTLLTPLTASQDAPVVSSYTSIDRPSKVSRFVQSARTNMPFVKQQLILGITSPVTWLVATGLVVLLFVLGVL